MFDEQVKIVLCKGVTRENDPQKSYKSVIEKAGFKCDILPALNFEFVNLEDLLDFLKNHQHYSGLIFTSQRSIEAIEILKTDNPECLNNWKHLPAYCVGPATATLAKERLKLENILGDEAGNAENLANFIVANVASNNLPLLYPCSEIARETIDKVLTVKEINFRKIVVYKTLTSKTLGVDFEKIVTPPVKYLVFFSPSVAECVIPLLHDNETLNEIKLIAIGQVTGDALSKLGAKVAAVASKPEPMALLKAIQSCS